MTRLLFALLLVCSLAPRVTAEDFESALSRLVADIDSDAWDQIQGAVAPLVALPKTSRERARVVAALTPLLERQPTGSVHEALSLVWSQVSAAQVLALLGPEAEPALLVALSLEYESAHETASMALAGVGPAVIPRVFERLRTVGRRKTYGVDMILRKIGDPGFPAMQRALEEDPSPDVRFVVAHALEGFGEAEAAPLLIAALRGDSDPAVRLVAGRSLCNRSDAWPSAAPALLEALEGAQDPLVRRGLASLVGSLGPAGVPGIPEIGAGYRSAETPEDQEVYAEALFSLGISLRSGRREVRWWTFFEVYPGSTFALTLFLVAWLLLAPRVGRYGLSGGALAAKTLVIALVPAGLLGGASYFVLTRPWSEPFFVPLDREHLLPPDVIAAGLGLIAGIAGWLAARWRPHAPAPSPPADGERVGEA